MLGARRLAVVSAALTLFGAAGVEARECKPSPVVETMSGWLGEFEPQLLPKTKLAWQDVVRNQFGGAWADYGKATAKSTHCEGIVNASNIKCTVSAKPCKDADARLAPPGPCSATTCTKP